MICHRESSAWLGGVLVEKGLGYGPLWAVNLCLAAVASGASVGIRFEGHTGK